MVCIHSFFTITNYLDHGVGFIDQKQRYKNVSCRVYTYIYLVLFVLFPSQQSPLLSKIIENLISIILVKGM